MTQRESSYSENVTVDEGFDPGTAVWTRLHYEGDTLTIQRTQDMEPVLAHVDAMREQNEQFNNRWGEGRLIGHIPALMYGKICRIADRNDRTAAVLKFFRENPRFCAFDKALRR